MSKSRNRFEIVVKMERTESSDQSFDKLKNIFDSALSVESFQGARPLLLDWAIEELLNLPRSDGSRGEGEVRSRIISLVSIFNEIATDGLQDTGLPLKKILFFAETNTESDFAKQTFLHQGYAIDDTKPKVEDEYRMYLRTGQIDKAEYMLDTGVISTTATNLKLELMIAKLNVATAFDGHDQHMNYDALVEMSRHADAWEKIQIAWIMYKGGISSGRVDEYLTSVCNEVKHETPEDKCEPIRLLCYMARLRRNMGMNPDAEILASAMVLADSISGRMLRQPTDRTGFDGYGTDRRTSQYLSIEELRALFDLLKTRHILRQAGENPLGDIQAFESLLTTNIDLTQDENDYYEIVAALGVLSVRAGQDAVSAWRHAENLMKQESSFADERYPHKSHGLLSLAYGQTELGDITRACATLEPIQKRLQDNWHYVEGLCSIVYMQYASHNFASSSELLKMLTTFISKSYGGDYRGRPIHRELILTILEIASFMRRQKLPAVMPT